MNTGLLDPAEFSVVKSEDLIDENYTSGPWQRKSVAEDWKPSHKGVREGHGFRRLRKTSRMCVIPWNSGASAPR